MQPKRAEEFTGPWDQPPRECAPARLADPATDAGASPALLLRDHLAQRLAAPDIAFDEPKLPMAARLGVIFGLGSACWLSVWFAAALLL